MKKTVIVLFIISLFFLLSGCWDNKDITEMAVAAAIGVDKIDNQYEVTVQIVNPSSLKGGSGGGKGGSSEKKTDVTAISETGESPFDAIRNLLKVLNKKVFFGQTKIIVFSEKIAVEGISEVIDLFERDTEFKYRMQIIITKDITAKELLKAKSEMSSISAVHIDETLKNYNAIGKTKTTTLLELTHKIERIGEDPVISVIQPQSKKEQYDIEDLRIQTGAVFNKDKLVGYLDSQQMRGYLFTQNNVESTIIVLHKPYQDIERISLEIKETKAKIDVKKIDNNKFIYIVKLKVDSSIGSQFGGTETLTESKLNDISEQCSKSIENEIRNAFDISKKLDCDIFGFGDAIHRKYTKDWEQIKYEWGKLYSENELEVTIDTKISSVGLIQKFIMSK